MAVFTSCENDDTDFSHIIDGAEVEVKDIEFDSTPLDEESKTFPLTITTTLKTVIFILLSKSIIVG